MATRLLKPAIARLSLVAFLLLPPAVNGAQDADDAFLEGWERYQHYTRDNFIKAIPHFERALELDPNYARAHAALAAVYIESWWNAWLIVDGGFRGSSEGARKHLKEAMQDPTPLALRVASLMHIIAGEYDGAMAEAQRAVDLDPNDPNGYEAMARVLIRVGRPAEALDFIKRAEKLDPQSRYLLRLGVAQFHLERYEETVATMLKYSKRHTDDFQPLLYLAAAYGYLGQKQNAESAFETYNKIRVSLDRYPATSAMDQVGIYYLKDGGGANKTSRIRIAARGCGGIFGRDYLEKACRRRRTSVRGRQRTLPKTREEKQLSEFVTS
ncbi:MAG: tetratricopeptide repeat protein [Gammaproteobacteria bacterium]|nr:tetratricopeptide repeat protein [Gammaproteobacteria bacterium]